MQGHLAPSSSDSGSTGSLVYDFYWGMELYPRLGTSFDLKTWTNCRMGMMGWGVLTLCYTVKQLHAHGHITNSLAVSVLLMHLYIFKFFLCVRSSALWLPELLPIQDQPMLPPCFMSSISVFECTLP